MNEHRPAHSHWRKSTHSDSHSGTCVEVARVDDAIALRDSRDPDGAVLVLGPDQWRALRSRLRSGA
jgi:hypothetical protein